MSAENHKHRHHERWSVSETSVVIRDKQLLIKLFSWIAALPMVARNDVSFSMQQRPSLWSKYFLLFGLGALSAGAFAPFYLWPLCCAGITFLLVFLDQSASPKQAFWLGWWWGWGFFTTGLYWISVSLTVDLQKFFWILPFSVLGLPAFLALFIGFAGLLAFWGSRPGFGRWILFAITWSLCEWLRGHILTGFPWNLTAYIWGGSPFLMQSVSGLGAYGLGLITLLWLSVPYLFLREKSLLPEKKAGAIFLLLSLGSAFLLGKIYVDRFPLQEIPGIWMRIVQPNISQKEKWRAKNRNAHVHMLVHLSLQPSSQPLTHIIWPEAAIPFFLTLEHGLHGIPPLVDKKGALLVGAPRLSTPFEGRERRVWNSLWVLNHAGSVVSVYDKNHLVPFGEYVPLRAFVNQFMETPWLKKITAGDMDFSVGPGPQTLLVPGAPSVSPLICYETIFPGEVTAPSQVRPGWLLNLTNDAWFGDTSGPYQHLDSARFRAIEEGLPLVRAANTGISAVIDAHGRILQFLPLNRKGILDFTLPQALPPTLYHKWGDLIFWLNMFGLIFLGWVSRKDDISYSYKASGKR